MERCRTTHTLEIQIPVCCVARNRDEFEEIMHHNIKHKCLTKSPLNSKARSWYFQGGSCRGQVCLNVQQAALTKDTGSTARKQRSLEFKCLQ